MLPALRAAFRIGDKRPMPAATQPQLFETPEPAGVSPVRAARVRKAVFANLGVLKRARPAAVVAPAFAEWEAKFLALCDLLPETEANEARAALAAEIARLKAETAT
ncbi:MAG TPA: hypothetical protein DDZ68_05300 [Parvularcula sp.]|nr:hypothetical protein [Parvularcula sp.]HBS30240.1 hypothetical protein [Parvularcula sp.]